MVKKTGRGRRERGHCASVGTTYQVLVYADIDPLTGRELRLTALTTDAAEAERIPARFRAQVDEQSHARTKATFRAAMAAWIRVHEIEETLLSVRGVSNPLTRYPLRRSGERGTHVEQGLHLLER
jgi:hypothetical protein